MERFDCAVIGAGPAGAVAAYELAKAGRTVLLLEKAKLPRLKPCGGGVSPQVQEWLDFDLGPSISHVADRLRATWRTEDPVEGEIPGGARVWMVRREHFDHFLAQTAAARGADLREGTQATGIEWCEGRWQITMEGEVGGVAQADFVIAADGAKGQAAKWLGFDSRKRVLAGAIEAESPLLVEEQDGVIHLEFGFVRGGYLWNFPKSDGHSVGIGAFKGNAPKNMRGILGEYSRSFDIDLAVTPQAGHPIAAWDGNFPLHGRNALLAGEAACVVDPFTAEGIRPAMFSGIQAARAVHQALSGDSGAFARYSKMMRDEHGVDMAWARRVAKMFYAFPRASYDYGVKDPAALGFMGKLLTGSCRYRDIGARGLSVLKRGLVSRSR
jgi:geranylgeranyl reductase family protein